jgi:hypothetical protein
MEMLKVKDMFLNSSQSIPGITIRTQFTFTADDPTLGCVLKEIAGESVNIAGFIITKICEQKNLVRLVVGTLEVESRRDLRAVRNTLISQCIIFEEAEILALSTIPSGVPGGLSGLYNSLWCRVEVFASYMGEFGVVYLQVSNIRKALDILSRQNVQPCQNKCC